MAIFPLAVSVGSRLNRWKTKPILWRRNLVRAASLNSVRSFPSTRTFPREACARPPITYSKEDLPHPEGPITATDSFFFQAEDGIRDYKVTGVQTCALPIWPAPGRGAGPCPPAGLPPARRQRR